MSLEHLSEVAEDLTASGKLTDAGVICDAIAEIERLRAQNVGRDVVSNPTPKMLWAGALVPIQRKLFDDKGNQVLGVDQALEVWAAINSAIETISECGVERGAPSVAADNLEEPQAFT